MSRSQIKWVIRSFLLITAIGSLAPPVRAADEGAAADKSQYTLFDPVPADLMRSFSSDRPTKSNSPYTVDAGHFQYEADISNWSYDRFTSSGLTTSNLILGDAVLKAGMTQNTDLEIALAPLNFDQTKNRSSGALNKASGFGDVYTRVKYNVLGNEGGTYALALATYIKAPTAAHNVGNNHWEGGGYIPFTAALPQDWTLSLMSQLDILENANLNGMHTNYQNLVNLSHPVFDSALTGYVEFWSDVDTDQGAPTQYTADFALAWLARDTLQLDAGINIGLNKAATDLQPYLGISQRF